MWNSGWERKRTFLLPGDPKRQRWRPSRLSRSLEKERLRVHSHTGGQPVQRVDLMHPLIPDPAELELMLDAAKGSEAVVAELDSAFMLEAIPVPESTLTPVMEKILQTRPSSCWGINE
jgi:hypothetical protein